MATISGRVIDYDNDNPIQNVTVLGIAENGNQFASTKTNTEGKFTISDVGFDNLYSKIRFVAPGYATQEMRPASANNVDIPLPKSGTMQAFTLTLKQKNPIVILIGIAVAIGIVYLIIKKVKL